MSMQCRSSGVCRNSRTRLTGLAAGICTALLAGCGGSGGDNGLAGGGNPPPLNQNCTNSGQVLTVLDAMEDLYFWNDEPEQQDKYAALNPDAFADADELLDFLRWKPAEFDREFTHITDAEDENRFFGPGEYIGYGFSFSFDPLNGDVVITQVFPGDPADDAGFERGQNILEVDGRTILEIENAEGLDEAFGDAEVGVMQEFKLQFPGELAFTTTATKELITLNPVPQHRIIDVGGRLIGYMEFRSFISTAPPLLSDAFAAFAAVGVRDVIVDVRYNGGGLVSVADYFVSLLAGPANVGQIASFTRYNQASSIFNETLTFSSELNSINLDSIVFITTVDSASASELVINSLQPYLDVALVGDRTFGKPVGQSAVDFCERRLRIVAFETLDVNETGRYFDGIPVDCPAVDNVSLQVGDETEESLAAALTYVTTGSCPIIGGRAEAELQAVRDEAPRDGLRGRAAEREFSYAY